MNYFNKRFDIEINRGNNYTYVDENIHEGEEGLETSVKGLNR